VLSSTYFLESALRLAAAGELYSASPFEPKVIEPGERLPDLDEVDVVVLSYVAELDAADVRAFAAFVKGGGGLLVFTGENVTPQSAAQLASANLAVGQVQGIEHASDLPIRLANWDAKHPIFAPFADPQLGDLNRVAFSAATKIAPTRDAQVLATFRNGQPAVVERRVEKGSVVWFAATCDRRWSDWPRSRLYLPLVYQLLGHQSGLLAGGRVRQEVLETQGALASYAVPQRPFPTTPGVHAQEGYTLVVNMSPREAETDRATADDFAARFGLHLNDDVEETQVAQPQRPVAATELVDSELWPWLAGLLLATLLGEVLVANRTAG
jgi:hypothetical protein